MDQRAPGLNPEEPVQRNPGASVSGRPAPARKRYSSITFPLLILILFALTGWLANQVVQREVARILQTELKIALYTNIEALHLWFEHQKRMVEIWAEEAQVHQNVRLLLAKARAVNNDPDALLQSVELAALREKLTPVIRKYQMIGFVVFDRQGTQVGAYLDPPVGRRDLVRESDFVYKALAGRTVVTLPFKSEIALHDTSGKLQPDWPSMFAATPVRGEQGRVLGVLAFRLRPELGFSRIFQISHIGETGEAYAFNDQGYLLTESRFTRQLKESGILGPDQDTAILNLRLVVPATPENGGEARASQGKRPFTRMVRSALSGNPGIDLQGYPDYRGATVVGAWTWLPDYGLGLAVEQDVSEAYAPVIALRSLFFLIFAFLGITLAAVLVLRWKKSALEDKERRIEQALEFQLLKNDAIVTHAVDAIITIDAQGVIHSFNPAAERMFGYPAQEIIGQNIYRLMPEPYRSEHPAILDRLRKSGRREVSIEARPLPALRKDGTELTIELTVSDMIVDGIHFYLGVLRDVTERIKTAREVERLFRQNQLILSAAGEGIYGVDLEGRVTFINPTAASLIGYQPEELIGKFQHDILHHTRPDGTPYPVEECPIYMAFKDGQEHRVDSEVFWRKDGSSFPVEYISKPIREKDKIVGAVVTFRDITERLRAERALQLYAENLEKTNEELTNFTSVATHDLQEPLRKVTTLADRLRQTNEDRLDERGKDYLKRMVASVERMRQLIYDLLEYARTTSYEVTFEPVSLNEEIQEVLSDLEIQIENTGARIEVGPLPTIEGSRFQIRQLFQNLIGNALKFHQPGKPPRITIQPDPGTNGFCSIVVSDEGIGFDEKYRDKIFKPFQRLHRKGEREGSGIGLAVCQKIVARHRGRITAHSTPGKGSRFIVTLPLKQTGPLN